MSDEGRYSNIRDFAQSSLPVVPPAGKRPANAEDRDLTMGIRRRNDQIVALPFAKLKTGFHLYGGVLGWSMSHGEPAVLVRGRRVWHRRRMSPVTVLSDYLPTVDCHETFKSAVGRNFGIRRNFVDCSNANASFRSVGSLHALPKNEIPTGNPNTEPAGTVTLG